MASESSRETVIVDPIVIAKIQLNMSRVCSGEIVYLYGFTDSICEKRFIADCSIADRYILPKDSIITVLSDPIVDESCLDDPIPLLFSFYPKMISVKDTRLDLGRLCPNFPTDPEHVMVQGPRFPLLMKSTDVVTNRSHPPIDSTSPAILNPHHLVLPTSPSDSLVAFDSFQYYHYGVDGFNDIGWGCAYRSIQTVLSWFGKGVTIPDIQFRLQSIDYAHANLKIGSSTWIGCVEAGAVITDRTGHDCKILHARNIDELENHILTTVRNHFITGLGCPVMVGAGDYAFVLAGVALATKQVLIIDPHGQQSSDAVKKGYIGWKSIRKQFDFKKVNAMGGFINVLVTCPNPAN